MLKSRSMRIPDIPFQTTDWADVEPTTHEGEQGVAHWRTRCAEIRVRMVDYFRLSGGSLVREGPRAVVSGG